MMTSTMTAVWSATRQRRNVDRRSGLSLIAYDILGPHGKVSFRSP